MPDCLVIFDCDGVLVDSEVLSARVMREMAAESGLAIAHEDALPLIRGRKVAEWVAELAAALGRPLPDTFIPEFRRRTALAFSAELRAVPHIEQVLLTLPLPYCTASSAPAEKIRLTLGLTGLLPYFEGRVYSAYEVGAWKPDPGLFRHAAADMGTAPGRCAVVEDSVVGVRAGVAAGMTVFGYAPHGSGTDAALGAAGAITFPSMERLPALLDAWHATAARRTGGGRRAAS
ncbi:HAD family hydrolase [Streptomyces sp. ISL-11]|uniref:HAD family hydrolase n=1 Tax=Streptomyces sp. ISL-11 TaxID=2819174 RepID=UPI001BECE835|nr:HAD family hydrolase [Streptomyces sp. ISL-11]MBT2384689.1 HAD family hydrolase [Streptomyces sp. ISL-11]